MRTRSTALRCTIVISQERALPRWGSKRLAVRQISRNASWVTYSAWARSRTTRSAGPCTRGAVASSRAAKAAYRKSDVEGKGRALQGALGGIREMQHNTATNHTTA